MLIIDLKVYDPEQAAARKRPFELAWDIHKASKEQLFSGVLLLRAIASRLEKHFNEKYPNEWEDMMLKYGTGQVTGVEQEPGVEPEEPTEKDKDADYEPEDGSEDIR